VTKSGYPRVTLIEDFKTFRDERGTFQKIFRADKLEKIGFSGVFRESFVSFSEAGVLRGMHFQLPPFDHWKLVACVEGAVTDVTLDLRKESYGEISHFELTRENGNSLLIPPGYAHGFSVKGSGPAALAYLTSTEHQPSHDRGILWNSFDYPWVLPEERSEFIISDRDRAFPKLAEFISPW
jgi:dTDP-4-dehydrorhamnose 3,5-epimerase